MGIFPIISKKMLDNQAKLCYNNYKVEGAMATLTNEFERKDLL